LISKLPQRAVDSADSLQEHSRGIRKGGSEAADDQGLEPGAPPALIDEA
jgi:hypothetical protein